jgi:hypothetical protein
MRNVTPNAGLLNRHADSQIYNTRTNVIVVIFEVFTAMTMKNAVFLDVEACRSCMNRRFGGI